MATTQTSKHPIVDQRHPWLDDTLADSVLFSDSYLGGRHWGTGYLYQHYNEGDTRYAARAKRAHYINYIASPLNLFFAAIFKEKTLARDKIDEDFAKDVDRQGTSINAFFRQVGTWAAVKDISYVFVDVPQLPTGEQPLTRQQQKDAGLFPYFTLLQKADVLDWIVDRYGNLISVKIRQTVSDYSNLAEERKPTEYAYKIWTRESWQGYDKKGDPAGAKHPHLLKSIPLVPMYAEQIGPMQGLSWIRDIANINRMIYNYDSVIDDFLYLNGISQLAVQANDDDAVKGMLKSNSEVIRYPGALAGEQPVNPPFYLTADQAPYTSLTHWREGLKVTIYLLFKVRLLNPLATAVSASGESKAQDYIATNQTLADLADAIQDCENRCHYYRQLWLENGIEKAAKDQQAIAEYPDSFDIVALDDQIKQMLDLRDIDTLPPTFWNVYTKDLVAKLLPKLDEETRKEIMDEIDILTTVKAAQKIVETATSGEDEEPEPEEADTEREDSSHG